MQMAGRLSRFLGFMAKTSETEDKLRERAPRGQVRGAFGMLVPHLPRGAWWAVGGYGISAVGSGFVLPFNTVYLHAVRGFSTGAVGLVLATVAAAGLVAMPAAGALADRLGPNRVIAGGAMP